MSDSLKTMSAAAKARAEWLEKVAGTFPDAYSHEGRVVAEGVRKQAEGVQLSGEQLHIYALIGEGRVYDPRPVNLSAFFASMHADEGCRKEMIEHAVKL